MNRILLTLGITLGGILTSLAQAQVIPLTVDSAQSSVQISIAGFPDSSSVSGNLTLDLQSSDPPSGNVQITGGDLVLDESLSFSLFFGAFTASTSPGDVTISLVTPGAPVTVSGNSFDQLDNLFELSGDLNTFQIFGGSETVELSTIDLSPADLNSINVTQSGNVVTISSSFVASEMLDIAGGVPVDIQATFVATGVVPVSVLLGDVNLDNAVDLFDIAPFISILTTPGAFQAEADIDQSGEVDLFDIAPFIDLLTNQ